MITLTTQAFLFDFDGVIAQSEKLHFVAALETAKKYGIQFDEEYYLKSLLGFDDWDLFETVCQDRKLKVSRDEIRQMMKNKNTIFLERIASEIAIFPGVREFIISLHQSNIPIAIVSGARRSEIESVLKNASLETYFRFLVTADDVVETKPDPEPYEKAIETLQLDFPEICAAKCWALEDSPAGIASAKAAGLNVIGITNSVNASKLQNADVVIGHVGELNIQKML